MRRLFPFVLFFLLIACEENKPANIEVRTRQYEVPSFNADSAFQYIETQLAFGPRVPGQNGHLKCADWLESKLSSFGFTTHREPFKALRYDGTPINGVNLMGSINPKAKKRLFLCAHWDSRFQADHDKTRRDIPIPGADDGASGVAVALEIGRQLAALEQFKLGLDIVFFDAEDQGEDGGNNTDSWGIGAQKWSNRHKNEYRPAYGILLDMVGAGDARYYKEEISVKTAPNVVYKIWNTAEKLGFSDLFINQDGRTVVDDHYFIYRNAGWPVADIIHTRQGGGKGFGPHWHTHADDLSIIDRETLRRTGKVVLTVICDEDLGKN